MARYRGRYLFPNIVFVILNVPTFKQKKYLFYQLVAWQYLTSLISLPYVTEGKDGKDISGCLSAIDQKVTRPPDPHPDQKVLSNDLNSKNRFLVPKNELKLRLCLICLKKWKQ